MIYIPVIILIIFGIQKYDFNECIEGKSYLYKLILVYLVILSGFSYRMGGDGIVFEHEYPDYLPLYDNRVDFPYFFSFLNRMPGWVLLCSFCKTFSSSWVFFKIIHSLIFNILVFEFLKKNCKYLFSVIFFFFILLYFNFNFQYLRQALAVGLFLSSIQFYNQNKWGKYYLYCIAALSFHDSAIIVFFLPLLKCWNYSKKQIVTLCTVFILVIIFRGFFIERSMTLFSNEYLAMRIGYYASQYEAESVFSLYSNVIFNILLPLYLNIYLKQNNANTSASELSLAYIVVYAISMVFPIAYRMNLFFILFYYVLIIETSAYYFIKQYKRQHVRLYFLVCIFFVAFKGRTYFTNYGQTDVPSYVQFIPYSSVFDKTKIPNREKILIDAEYGWMTK